MKARDRMIRIGFYQNEVVGRLSPLAALLIPGLWQLADREGRLENRPDRIKAMLFPYRKNIDIAQLLKEISEVVPPLISFYENDRFLVIHNFLKHQRIHNNEAKSELPEPNVLPCSDMQIHVDTRQPELSSSVCICNSISNSKCNSNKSKDHAEDKRKPIVRFNEWIKDNQVTDLTEMVKAALGVNREGLLNEHEWKWGKFQIDKMRTWIIGNPDKGNKQRWGRFVAGWLNREASSMTEQDEEAFKISESRQREQSEPTQIGEIK